MFSDDSEEVMEIKDKDRQLVGALSRFPVEEA